MKLAPDSLVKLIGNKRKFKFCNLMLLISMTMHSTVSFLLLR